MKNVAATCFNQIGQKVLVLKGGFLLFPTFSNGYTSALPQVYISYLYKSFNHYMLTLHAYH